jgi:hypothetical protein
VPGREKEVVVFVGVVDRSLNVDDNWVAARDFGVMSMEITVNTE